MNRVDLFTINAGILHDIAVAISKACPKALIAIITNPLNSCVPVVSEVLKKAGKYDPNRIFGVTTLDVVRAQTIIGEVTKTDPLDVNVQVIGGHSDDTIIPVLSQSSPSVNLSSAEMKTLIERIQKAGMEVVEAKAGTGSATLSTAYASANFIFSLAKALKGETNVVECSYVHSNLTPAAYFSTPLLLGKNGIEKNLGLPTLNTFEQTLLVAAVSELQHDIKLAQQFIIDNLS